MKYCAILASGEGRRMWGADTETSLPKQFVEMSGKPLICYSINTVVEAKCFDKVYIGVLEKYYDMLDQIISKWFPKEDIKIVIGDSNRMGTFYNIVKHIEANNDVSKGDLCCMMDANRPLIKVETYLEGMNLLNNHDIVCLARPVVDGVCKVDSNGYIYEIPNKRELCSFQTPEFFRLEKLKELAPDQDSVGNNLGIAEIFLANGIRPYTILSDDRCFKVTTPIDIKVLDAFVGD